MNLRLLSAIFLIISYCSCVDQKAKQHQITVYCASSLTPVIEQINKSWIKNHEEKVIINSASSGTLARQIENGAQADIFISANTDWMQYLIGAMLLKTPPQTVATNRLALIVPENSNLDSMSIQELLPQLKYKMSISDPGHVPLGKYTKEVLDYYANYADLSSQLILTKDARSALRLVELGEVAYGIVYLSDALTSGKVKIISLISQESHSAIYYQAIILTQNATPINEFFQFISAQPNKEIWRNSGFLEPIISE